MRHTKIIATLGPASSTDATIEALISAGVDVVRLNFSHGSHEGHRTALERVRAAAARLGRHVAVMQDLSGPKIRTGEIEGGGSLMLNPGDRLNILIGDMKGRPGVVSTTYAPLATAVSPGDRLLLDDGKIELRVRASNAAGIETEVVDGGPLGEHKGINAPNVTLPPAGLTAKDEADLRFGIGIGVDLLALSFVQSPRDIEHGRAVARELGKPTLPFIAKLERPEAIERLADIVRASDAVMVARGDLGLELPLEHVPQVQKEVLRIGREHGVPVIVATQVLESMRTEPRPTRAEVSDAAGAVDAGADAIMLSGETAVGVYPVRSVQVLDSIITSAEALPPPWSLPLPHDERPDHLPPLCDAAVTLAARGAVDALIAVTREGRTARLLSARRPDAPIIAITPRDDCARRLCLWWGVLPVVEPLDAAPDHVVARVIARLQESQRLPAPATVVIVNARPELDQSDANFVHVRRI